MLWNLWQYQCPVLTGQETAWNKDLNECTQLKVTLSKALRGWIWDSKVSGTHIEWRSKDSSSHFHQRSRAQFVLWWEMWAHRGETLTPSSLRQSANSFVCACLYSTFTQKDIICIEKWGCLYAAKCNSTKRFRCCWLTLKMYSVTLVTCKSLT